MSALRWFSSTIAAVAVLGVGGCLSVDPFEPSADATATADADAVVVVDTVEPDTADAACVPQCTGLACGPDGCGGTCGVCDAHDTCSAGRCQPSLGDRCAAPIVIAPTALPFFASGSTAAREVHADLPSTTVCDASATADAIVGRASPDQVYAFTPTVTAVYEIRLSAEFDAVLSLRDRCDEALAACVAAASAPELDDVVVATLDAGTPYWIVVDGYGDDVVAAGAYALSVSAPCVPSCGEARCGDDGCGGSCGACEASLVCHPTSQLCVPPYDVAGNTCAAPLPIDALPFVARGDTRYASDDAVATGDACDIASSELGAGSPDHVYLLVAPTAAIYRVEVDGDFVIAVYRRSECDGSSACLAVASDYGHASLDLWLEEQETAWLAVDGAGASVVDRGPYTLTVSSPCLPACGGAECGPDGCGGSCGDCGAGSACDGQGVCRAPVEVPGNLCENPFAFDAAPAQVRGDTTLRTNDYAAPAGACAGLDAAVGAGSPDAAVRFVADHAGRYLVALHATFDSALYVVGDCGAVAGSCVGGDDHLGVGTERVTFDADENETLYVIVDGYDNGDGAGVSGLFTVTVEEVQADPSP
ncbi:MAG: hypothetical protein KC635_01995 [Myxococcales bacterium]|nr:hypothetical protein [Myxococcales bacterium]MCB9737502.1 hypothetical protein [Deltaproteobacteria bacterium]